MAGGVRVSFHTKLLATFVALAVIVGVAALVVVQRTVGSDLVAAIDRRLESQAKAVAVWVENAGHPQRLAPRLAAVVDARVTVFGANGLVEGDSAGRMVPSTVHPEVSAAQRGEIGRATRLDPDEGRTVHFVAVPANEGRVVRLGVPLAVVESVRAQIWRQLLGPLGLALMLALALGFAWIRALARPLRQMARTAERLAAGDYAAADGPAAIDSPDELGVLSRAMATMAGEIRSQIRALTVERDLVSTVLDSLVEGVVVVDVDGAMLLSNPAADALLGADGLPPRLREVLRATLATSEILEDELEVRGARVRASSRRLGHDSAGAVLVLHDITRLLALEGMRREFVANAAHELRTPVTSIQGYAETLLEGPDDPAVRRQFLEVIHRNANRIARLVDDLLTLQRLDAQGATGRVRDAISVDGTVRHAIETTRAAAVRRGVAVAADLEPATVRGDAEGMEQIAQNLIDNAIKYGREGGAVKIAVRQRGDRVELEVADDGAGIAAEHRDKIFERFYRVDAGRARAEGGTGLGLAIVKQRVEGMGGSIKVEDAPTGGARFVVEFPAG